MWCKFQKPLFLNCKLKVIALENRVGIYFNGANSIHTDDIVLSMNFNLIGFKEVFGRISTWNTLGNLKKGIWCYSSAQIYTHFWGEHLTLQFDVGNADGNS